MANTNPENAKMFDSPYQMHRHDYNTPDGWNAKTENDEVGALYAIAARVVGQVSPTTSIAQASRFVGGGGGADSKGRCQSRCWCR